MTKRQWTTIAVIAFLILAYISFNIYSSKQFEKEGIFTIAKITCKEIHEQGSKLCFEVYYNGKTYSSHTGGIYGYSLGKYYFIKILPTDPTRSQSPLDQEVPECILKKGIPKGGWKEIPRCAD